MLAPSLFPYIHTCQLKLFYLSLPKYTFIYCWYVYSVLFWRPIFYLNMSQNPVGIFVIHGNYTIVLSLGLWTFILKTVVLFSQIIISCRKWLHLRLNSLNKMSAQKKQWDPHFQTGIKAVCSDWSIKLKNSEKCVCVCMCTRTHDFNDVRWY